MPFWPIQLFLPSTLPSATPTFNISREWNTGNIGVVSSFLGLNAGFRKKIIQLFDLGYASRLRLIFCISAGFFLCHIFISYVPTVEIIVEADGEQEEDDEVEYDSENSEDTEEEEEEQAEDTAEVGKCSFCLPKDLCYHEILVIHFHVPRFGCKFFLFFYLFQIST